MSDWKEIVKGGWHPEKDGTTLKGQVKGLIGRGDKSSSSSSSQAHSAAPITSLRDPSSFGPPPKHLGYGGYAPAASSAPGQPPPVPSRSGLHDSQQQEEQPAAEPKPYRVDTTGLDTSHLPPPPTRAGRSPIAPPPPPRASSPAKPSGGPPALPPRLPPRSNTSSPSPSLAPAQRRQTPTPGQPGHLLNQGAVDRLGAAGISVPGFGIGAASKKTAPDATKTASSSPGSLSELSARFSHLNPSKSNDSLPRNSSASSAPPPAQGTTWAQKQAALKTASDFRRDPTSVSLADARAAAGTANNFRQRHGDQVAAGARSANALNQKYGVADKIAAAHSGNNSGGGGGGGGGSTEQTTPLAQISGLLAKKKPAPPPPPKKKPALSDAVGGEPPPVPLATRPKF